MQSQTLMKEMSDTKWIRYREEMLKAGKRPCYFEHLVDMSILLGVSKKKVEPGYTVNLSNILFLVRLDGKSRPKRYEIIKYIALIIKNGHNISCLNLANNIFLPDEMDELIKANQLRKLSPLNLDNATLEKFKEHKMKKELVLLRSSIIEKASYKKNLICQSARNADRNHNYCSLFRETGRMLMSQPIINNSKLVPLK